MSPLAVERLEDRTLLAGPSLVSITTNPDSFLFEGTVRSEAPRELTFKFSPGQTIDPSTLGGITITRSGFDGVFQPANVYSDFNTNGAVLVEFDATVLGANGNGVSFAFTKNDLGALAGPTITVVGKAITVDLNTNPVSRTTAQGLIDAINSDPSAKLLVQAKLRSAAGTETTDLTTPAINYSPFVTAGANAASATTSFNTGTPLEIKLIAKTAGTAGNGISLVVNKAALAVGAPPTISVNTPQKTITVTLNTTGAGTTAQGLVTALNANLAASALIGASIPAGVATTSIAAPAIDYSPVVLGGANDVPVVPGYIGIGTEPNDVVFRFAETPPDDLYRIEIHGSGTTPLMNKPATGTAAAFNNGIDQRVNFRLDLGAQITSVVPQPVLRDKNINVLSVGLIADGDRLTVSDGQITKTFEFDDTATPGVRAGNVAVSYTAGQSVTTVAAALATKINAAGFDLTAAPTAGQVTLSGNAFQPATSRLVVNGGSLSLTEGGLVQRQDVVDVYFSSGIDALNPALATDPALYQLIDAASGAIQLPSAVSYNAASNSAKLKFAAPLPVSTYHLQVGVSTEPNNTTATAVNVGTLFKATLTPHSYSTNAWIGDDVRGSSSDAADVDLYKVVLSAADTLTAGVTPVAGSTLNTQIRFLLDPSGAPVPGALDNTGGAGAADSLTFALAAGTYYVEVSSAASGTTGSYRLDLDVTNVVPASDNNSSFATAAANANLGTLGVGGQQFASQIEVQAAFAFPPLPGGDDEPGHRQIPVEQDGAGSGNTPALSTAITTSNYNFQDVYGVDPQGNVLHNAITETQKQRTREIFEVYGHYLGIHFQETAAAGLIVATGDTRAVAPTIPPAGLGGIFGASTAGLVAIINGNFNYGNSDWIASAGVANWTETAFHEIGHALGLGHTFDLPSVMGAPGSITAVAEPVYPGAVDLVQAERINPPTSTDIDLYKFSLTQAGTLSAETIAQRLPAASTLDTVLSLYQESAAGTRTLIARNDDYYSKDSFLSLRLDVGTYYIGVTSTGNTNFDPVISDSGFGGTTEGAYNLKLSFSPDPASSLADTTGTPFDGDHDGKPGGVDNFWFQSSTPVTAANTLFVDKSFTGVGAGTLASPYNNIATALAAVTGATRIIRIEGNELGGDGDLSTPDGTPYLIGRDNSSNPLADGVTFDVPKGITVMIDAGAILKFQGANIDVGSSAVTIDRSNGALQVFGTPTTNAYFTSYHNDAIGGNSDGVTGGLSGGNWGGLVFRQDSDSPLPGVFLNYVDQANLSYGGGQVVVNSVLQVFDPIHLVNPSASAGQTARPTIAFNTITFSADAAISADPNSFDDRGDRIGPDVHGNHLVNNSINGLFVRIRTQAGSPVDKLDVPARFDDTDIVHVITENLHINGNPGGMLNGAARLAGRLSIDPGVVVKLGQARIETERGSSQLIAEGTVQNPIQFTSINDDRLGSGGTFDTSGNGVTTGARGDWGGLIFNAVSKGSIDHALITFAGGQVPIEGSFDSFNPIEIHGAHLRIANSVLEQNAGGLATGTRNGRGTNNSSTIFVRGAEPILVKNIIQFNIGNVISINVNSLTSDFQPDWGRSTGTLDAFAQFADNHGPLVRLNRIDNVSTNTATNGMEVRAEELLTEGVWDDTDIVHVVRNEISMRNFRTFGGLRLQSSSSASLVVKLSGANAGFTANGTPLDIDDRIGGTLQVVGTPGHAVVLTSLSDDTVGAGFKPDGSLQTDTNNNGTISATQDIVDVVLLLDDTGSFSGVNPTVAGVFGSIVANLSAALPNADFAYGVTRFEDYAAAGGFSGGGGSTDRPFILNQPVIRTSVPNFTTAINNALTRNSPGGGGDLPESMLEGLWQIATGAGFDGNGNGTTTDSGPAGLVTTQTNPGAGGDVPAFSSFTPDPSGPVLTSSGTLGGVGFRANSNHRIVIVSTDWGTAYQPDGLTTYTGKGGVTVPAANLQVNGRGTTPGGRGAQFQTTINALVNNNIQVVGLGNGSQPILPLQSLARLTGAVDLTGNPLFFSVSSSVATIQNGIQQAILGALANGASAGDWRSVKLDKYSNDRNVAVVNETEPGLTGGSDVNATPAVAQFLGTLAPNEKSGDDVQRLGYEIHGAISPDDPKDVDVYSFTGTAGSEVWFDIDRTSPALDTMLELVDANGAVLARSLDSQNSSTLSAAPGVTVRDMIKDVDLGGDFYGTNPRDAGMRIILPGTVGTSGTYFIRVRSQPIAGNENVVPFAGLTSGTYQLQVRLRQVDEKPGSTVRFADIHFATTGIEVLGLPDHSPLVGESAETTVDNDSLTGTPQQLGNLLTSDRNTISVAGSIDPATNGNDVDFYRFTLDYDLVEAIPGASTGGNTFSTVFDIDYADGLARPDTVMSVFDANGRLILIGHDSNVADDQPAPGQGSDLDDLSRGSVGKLDPFIGPVQLPAGNIPGGSTRTYYVAITSNQRLPQALDAYIFSGIAGTAVTNSLIRLEPVDSLQRVVEDHIGFTGYTTGTSTSNAKVDPVSGPLIDIRGTSTFTAADAISLQTNITPLSLKDVPLFVTTPGFLRYVNAFDNTTTVFPFGNYAANPNVQDIAMRSDGVLYAYSNIPGGVTGTVGQLDIIDTGTGNLTVVGNDSIPEPDGPPPTDFNMLSSDFVDALAFRRTGYTGTTPDYSLFYSVRQGGTVDRLYRADPSNGTTGIVNTVFQRIGNTISGAGVSGLTTGMAFLPTGQLYGVSNSGQFYTISTFSATATLITDFSTTLGGFQGLAPGPQNLAGGPNNTPGFYANTMFALTTSGRLVVLNANGLVAAPVFDSDIQTQTVAITGNPTGGTFTLTFDDGSGPQTTAPIPYNAPLSGQNEVQQFTIPAATTGGTFTLTFTDGISRTTGPISFFSSANQIRNALQAASASPFGNDFNVTIPGGFFLTPGAPFTVTFIGRFAGTNVNTMTANFSNLTPPGGAGVAAVTLLQGSIGLQQYLEALPNIGAGNVLVSGGPLPGAPVNVYFVGALEGTNFAAMTADGSGLTGGAGPGVTVTATTAIYGDGIADSPIAIVNFSLGGSTGLAFSPLDFNLWHPTMRRSFDAGHGIQNALDNSRDPVNLFEPTFGGNTGFVFRENNGGASLYFGLEEILNNTGISNNRAFRYGFSNGQYGVVNSNSQWDLASNGTIGDNYNLPGGALGSLVTNSFSLAGYDRKDKPTLYFNYYLQTDGANGVINRPMRDSARVFVSKDNGLTWEMLATNNSTRSSSTIIDAELPEFWSASRDEAPLTKTNQQVQELFDGDPNSGSLGWRQARVDLADYAGFSNLKFRFDFSTAGTMNQGLPGDQFGQFGLSGNQAPRAINDPSSEGFYIDDIIVGFAERGEMVTGAVANQNTFATLGTRPTTTPATKSADPAAPAEQLNGPYQLEIRRGTEYVVSAAGIEGNPIIGTAPNTLINTTFDTNDRMANAITLTAPIGLAIVDGQQFSVSDGINTRIFEFDNIGGVSAGSVAIPFTPADTAATVAQSMLTAILSVPGFGVNGEVIATSNRVQLIGAVAVTPITQVSNLIFSISPSSIPEDGSVTATGTVTRTIVISSPVTVTLTATVNGNRIVLPISVTIPANAASATFPLTGFDDAIAQGTQTVVIQAAAPGFSPVSATIDVTDNDPAALTVSIAPGSALEGSATGTASATITRNTPTTAPLTVTVTSLDPSEILLPLPQVVAVSSTVNEVEPNDSLATAQNVDNAGWSTAFNGNIGDAVTNTSTTIPHVTIIGTGDGTFDYYSFTVANAGDRGIFDIDFTNATFNDTEIFLYDTSGFLLAENDDSSTTVGAGGSTSFFNSFLEYTFLAAGTYIIGVGEFNSTGSFGGITGNVPDFGDSYRLQVSIQNHPISIPPVIPPVLRSTTTVTIPAGSTSVTVPLAALQDLLADGDQTARIVARAPGFASGTGTLTVLDTGAPVLTVNVVAGSVLESAGPAATTGTVSINLAPLTDLIINLNSNDVSEATVPVSVVILAGQLTSAPFNVNAVDDLLVDGPQTVTITATLSGFASSATDTLIVNDDPTDVVPLGTAVWVEQGPAPIVNSGFTATPNGQVTGAVQGIAVDPTNANRVYVGGTNGGVWRTTNALAVSPTWTPLTDSLPALSIGALEFDPTDATHQRLIAGIGRVSTYGGEGSALNGLLLTTNGGATWTQLTNANLLNENITSVAARGTTLLAASDNTYVGGFFPFIQASGLFRSTDNGASFTLISGSNGLPAGRVSDLVGDPVTLTTFYAAVASGASPGVYRSTDSGATWSSFNAGLSGVGGTTSKIELAVHHVGGTTAVYAVVINNSTIAGLFRSQNGGAFAQLDTPQVYRAGGPQGDVSLAVAADSANSNIVYVGGDSGGANGFIARVDASLASGSQVTRIEGGSFAQPHVDSREMVVDPNGNLLYSSDGGLFRLPTPTTNAGAWVNLNSNLNVAEIHDVAYDTIANVLVAGLQDNDVVFQQSSGSRTWSPIPFNADGGDVEVDNLTLAGSGQSIRYYSFQNLGGFRRDVYDATNTLISTTPINTGIVFDSQFRTPVELNAVDPRRLVIGGSSRVYESLNQGNTIASIANVGVNEFMGTPMAYGGIRLGVPNPDVLYVGSGNRVFVRTVSGGPLAAAAALPAGAGTINDIALDPDDWRTAYVADDNQVFRTTDAGATWSDVTGTLSDPALHALAVVNGTGGNPDRIFVSGSKGVSLMLSNALGTWNSYGAGLPRATVHDLDLDVADNVLVAGTFGRGAWTTTAIGGVTDLTVTVTGATTFSEGAGAAASTIRITRFGTTGDLPVTIASSDSSEVTLNGTGNGSIVVTIPSGSSFITVNLDAVDDTLSDGTQTVFLTASSPGLNSVIGHVDVTDDDPVLYVTVDIAATSITEFGSSSFTVTRNGDLSQPLTVSLANSDSSEVSVPASVTIPAGSASVTGTLTGVFDVIVDGTQTAIITPTAAGYQGIADAVDVTDVSSAFISLSVTAPSVLENAGPKATTGTVFLFPALTSDLTVFLYSSDVSEATVPASVVIPAGQTSVTFDIGAVDEFFDDGTRTVTITAYASGFFRASDTLDVIAVNGPNTAGIESYNRLGDRNLERDQGHIEIESNFIRDSVAYGIKVDAGTRDTAGNLAHPGSVINTPTLNNGRLAPGVALVNNVIAGSGTAGILFSGDPNGAGVATAEVPFGKIVNNTIYGGASAAGIGIQVTENASPTLMNNIIANTVTGISIDGTSGSTVVGTSLFQGNATDLAAPGGFTASNTITLTPTETLFINPSSGNFYLASGSRAIDSSLNTLADRPSIVSVTSPLGIPQTPLFSPDRDLFGQLRIDDPTQAPPPGLGSNIYKDRGAVERADFIGGFAVMVSPLDNDPPGVDLDPTDTHIRIDNPPALLTQLVVKLVDLGIGIDDSTVTTALVVLQRTFVTGPTVTTTTLIDGTDYLFVYNPNTKEIFLRSVSTFPLDSLYTISIDNSPTGIRDLAGNLLQLNQPDGSVKFFITVTNGKNDAPVNTVPAVPALNEDTSVIFSAANNNAIIISDPDAFLGTNQVQVTLAVVNGKLTLPTTFGLNFIFSDAEGTGTGFASASNSATMTFRGTIPAINNALNGLLYTPNADYFNNPPINPLGLETLTITTDDLGNFLGNPAVVPASNNAPQTTVTALSITVGGVNDAPVVTLPAAGPLTTIAEDTPLFFTGASAIDVADVDALTGSNFTVTFTVSPSGKLTLNTGGIAGGLSAGQITANNTNNVVAVGTLAQIRATLADLNGFSYQGILNFNGSDALTVTADDQGNTGSGGGKSDTKSVALTVTAINDPPVVNVPLAAQTQTAFEDTNQPITGISITDVDLGAVNTLTVTLGVLHGTLTVSTTVLNGVVAGEVAGNGTGTVTVTALLAKINATLANVNGLTYLSTLNYNNAVGGADTLTVTADDSGKTGALDPNLVPPAQTSNTKTITVNVTPVNDAPVRLAPASMPTPTFIEGSGRGSMGLGSLSYGPGGAADEAGQIPLTYTVTAVPSAALGIVVKSGDTVALAAGNTLTLAELNGLEFITSADGFNDGINLVLFNFRVQDTGSGVAPNVNILNQSVTVTVTPVNDPPSVTVPAATVSVNEDTNVAITGISIADPDENGAPTFKVTFSALHGTLTVSTTVPGGLDASDVANISGNGTGSVAVISKMSKINATLAAANGLTYRGNPDYNHNVAFTETLTVLADDQGNTGGGSLTASGAISIDVIPQNDAPVRTAGTVGPTVTVLEDSGTTTLGLGSVDYAAGPATATDETTLQSLNYVVTAVPASTLGDVVYFEGFGSQVVVVPSGSYTLAQVRLMAFRTAQDANGSGTFSFAVKDDGGSPGVDTLNESMTINVTAVNDPPVLTVPVATVTAAEDVAVSITGVSVADPDESSAANFTVTLSVVHGTIALSTTVAGGLVAGDVATNGTSTVTATATMAKINATFGDANGIRYLGSLNYNNGAGAETLTVVANDQGSSGAPNLSLPVALRTTDTKTVAINVTAVNDPPVVTVPSAQTTAEDAAKTIAGISIADVDAGGATVLVTLNAAHGALTVSSTVAGGLTAGEIVGNGTATVTLSSSLAKINATLANASGVTYLGTADYNSNISGNDTLTVTANDQGNAGAPDLSLAPLARTTDAKTVSITLTPVNDAPVRTTGAVGPVLTVLEDSGTTSLGLGGVTYAAGPATASDEVAGQTLTFTVTAVPSSTLGDVVFDQGAGPIVVTASTNYTLAQLRLMAFRTAADANGGPATFAFRVQDNGGTSPGVDTLNESLAINVTPVNDVPSLNPIADPAAILEDTPGLQTVTLTGIGAGPANESAQTLLITATSNNPGLIPNPTVTYTSPNATGTLSYTPVANQNGSALITVTVTDSGSGVSPDVNTFSHTFTVTVTAVNDAPTLNPLGNLSLLEDDVLQGISLSGITSGPANESGQTLTVTAVSSNPALIPNPVVTYTSPNSTGLLELKPVANQNGGATITVTVTDNGGLANGGVNSVVRTFTVNVAAVNDAPTLDVLPDLNLLEDAGQQIINLTGITVGAANESGQTITLTATSNNTGLVPNPIVTYTSANATGTLNFTPPADQSGTATITVIVQDNGGTVNGGADLLIRTFTVNIASVNDAPTINAISNPAAIKEDSGQQTISLSGIGAGAANESSQTLTVTATSSNPSVVPNPTVNYTSPAGTGSLNYTPVPNQSGVATITVTLKDNGGTAAGGVDTAVRTFTVNVIPLLAPVLTPIGSKSVNELTTLIFSVSATDADTPQDNLTFTASGLPAGASFDPTTHLFTWTPAETQGPGTANVTFKVFDGKLSNTETVAITVAEVNQSPVVTAAVGTASNAGTIVYNVSATDADLVPSSPQNLTLSVLNAPAGATFTVTNGNPASGVFTWTPSDAQRPGTYFITFAANDGVATSTVSVTVTLSSTLSGPVRMYRAYNPTADYHFFTTSQPEFANAVVNGYRDETTGQPGFDVLPAVASGANVIFRLYNKQTGRHYYTTSVAERDYLVSLVPASNPTLGWRYEKNEGFIYATAVTGTTEIFRLYNKNSGVHLYTENAATRDAILAQFPGVWVQHTSLGFGFAVDSTGALTGVAATQFPATAAAQALAPPVQTTVTPATSVSIGTSSTESVARAVAIDAAPVPATALASTDSTDKSADPLGDRTSAGDDAALDRFWESLGRDLATGGDDGLLDWEDSGLARLR